MSDEPVGPFVTVATFCEKTLDEKDGVPSLIRLVDRITFTPPPAVFDADGKPLLPSVELAFFVRITAKWSSGPHALRLMIVNPESEEKEIVTHKFVLDGKSSGANVRLNLTIGIKGSGFYWLKVYLNEEFISQVPLEIVEAETSESD